MKNRELTTNRSGTWAPARDLVSLHRGIDRLFDEMFEPFWGARPSADEQWNFNPATDVEETENHYLFAFDLPGVKKEDLKIDLNDNVLTVSGERKYEREGGDKNRRYTERSYGSFSRSFTLPAGVDASKIEASYGDGVLHVAVPKTEASKKGRSIPIGENKGGFLEKLLGRDKAA